jgi:hypothetical protein
MQEGHIECVIIPLQERGQRTMERRENDSDGTYPITGAFGESLGYSRSPVKYVESKMSFQDQLIVWYD